MSRRRQTMVPAMVRVPANPDFRGGGLLSNARANGYKAWTCPLMSIDLNSSGPGAGVIKATRLCFEGRKFPFNRIESFLTNNGAGITGGFVGVWSTSTRGLLASVTVPGAEWTGHSGEWWSGLLNTTLIMTEDLFVGYLGIGGSLAMAGAAGVTVDAIWNRKAGGFQENVNLYNGPHAALPDPLPALSVGTYRSTFWGVY